MNEIKSRDLVLYFLFIGGMIGYMYLFVWEGQLLPQRINKVNSKLLLMMITVIVLYIAMIVKWIIAKVRKTKVCIFRRSDV